MSKQANLLKLLDRGLLGIHSDHNEINSGGCAVFAALTYPLISRYFDNVKVKVIKYYGKAESVDKARECIESRGLSVYDLSSWSLPFNHVMLQFEVDGELYLLDSKGVTEQSSYLRRSGDKICEGSLTYEEIKSISSDKDGWNRSFDRQQIPSIADGLVDLFDFTLPCNGYKYG